LANEGLEARKKEDEVAAKKRKAEDDKVWEGMHFPPSTPSISLNSTERREERVDTWRAFANNNTRRKKKQKVVVLG